MTSFPQTIVLFVSYSCNCRCIMCSAWKKPQLMGINAIESFFGDPAVKNSVRTVNITGGEPTLRADILDIIKIITDRCPRLERIDLSTNGLDTERVLDVVERICAGLINRKNIRLGVCVSVDGVGALHDNIRGVPGAFNKVNATIKGLKELYVLYGFSLGLNCTVTRMNCQRLGEILQYADNVGLGLGFTLAANSEIGVESLPVHDNFELGIAERKAVSSFIDDLVGKNKINVRYAGFMQHWLKKGTRKGRCAFKEGRAWLIEPDGTAYQCGNFSEFKLGNIKELDKLNGNSRIGFWSKYLTRCRTCNSNCYLE